MIQIKLTQDWKTRKKGEIINISEKGGTNFINEGYAVYPTTEEINNFKKEEKASMTKEYTEKDAEKDDAERINLHTTTPISIQDITKFYSMFKHTKPTELRFIDHERKKPVIKVFVSNEEEFISEINKYSNDTQRYNAYIGGRDRTASGDENVISSYGFFIDIDDHEHSLKESTAPSDLNKVKEFLKSHNIQWSMIGFTGGGYHLYVPHNLVTFSDSAGMQKYERLLQNVKTILQEKNNLNIDTSVFNLERVSRVIGTFNYKWNELSKVLEFNDLDVEQNGSAIRTLIDSYEDLQQINVSTNIEVTDVLKKYNIKSTHPWLHDVITKQIVFKQGDSRNNTLLKIAMLITVENSMSENEWKAIALEMCKSCTASNLTNANGWRVQMTKNNKLYDNYKNIINKFIREHKDYKLTPYILNDIEKEKNLQYHSDKQVLENSALENKYKLKEAITEFTKDAAVLAKSFCDIQPIYYDTRKIWWLWEHHNYRWSKVDETEILNYIRNNSGWETISSKPKWEILEALKQISRENQPLEPKKSWIQFKNKIYDLETNTTFPATHKYFMSNPIPWEIGETEDTPTIDRIFGEWMINEERGHDKTWIKTLYEVLGFCMLSYMPLHRIICLNGKGLNGKGRFLKLIENFVGVDNTCSSDIHMLGKNNFETSKLYKKLVCNIGEIDSQIFKQTAQIKTITGDDFARVEYKGKDSFDTHLYAKPIIACNELPETADKTLGFYRRWCIIDFFNTFNEKQDVLSEIPDIEYSNLSKKCIRIVQELLKRGEFTNEGTPEERENKYESHSNPIGTFIDKTYIKDADSDVNSKEFTILFNDYLESMHREKKSEISIGKSLKNLGYTKTRKPIINEIGNSTSVSMIKGLKLIE